MAKGNCPGSLLSYLGGALVIGSAALGAWVMWHDKNIALSASREALAEGMARGPTVQVATVAEGPKERLISLLADTRHMINAERLKMMKPTAYLINTCRGPVVDEKALIEALGNGTIAGAGLDVFDREPPPPNNPLFALQNVILTAHFAGPTWDNQYTRFRNAFDNCQRVVRGDKPLWVIPELRD